MSFSKMLRVTGFFLIGKGLLYFLSLIWIMYSYAERGIIGEYSGLFFFSVLFFTATMILGIYFSELGAIKPGKPVRKRILTLRKEIPRKRVALMLGIEFLGAIFILMNIPELPRLWISLIVEFITLIWAIIQREG